MFNENLISNGRQMLLEVEQDRVVSFIPSLSFHTVPPYLQKIVNLYTKKIPHLG